ncbi:MAG: heme biosynthesis protein HemY [Flavobacteriaceae bacterium]|nr:heme biosynthesis protein HemY [Flavobacteriaceae bacterium]
MNKQLHILFPFLIIFFGGFCLFISCSPHSDKLILNRKEYKDKLMGFWLGGCIANWTGLPTENQRTGFPFFTDSDFGKGKFNYVLDQNPWGADDDTDIEYIYQYAIEKFDNPMLSGSQISSVWQDHIGLPNLWVSNLAALGQMQNGAIPPETSLPKNNPMWDMIDAQLTTEIFGTLAPGRPNIALDMAYLPIRTTAYLHSKWASEFYIIMHSLAVLIDKSKSRKENILWLAEKARKRIPDWSYIADMYDFVKSEYDSNPDKDNWELTRDKVARRYQYEENAGYKYKYPWDSGINFAASMISLFYGEGDYKKTIRIGCMSGWDSDNPTSTWGGLLGLLYGHKELQKHFNKTDFSDFYNISRTRYNLPLLVDNFDDLAERGLKIIDKVVLEYMDGSKEKNNWVIPLLNLEIPKDDIQKTFISWETIEDNDRRWDFQGFYTKDKQWNASGATLTFGYENCKAEISFEGTAVQYFAYKSNKGGNVQIILDGKDYGEFSLKSESSVHGQYYVKIFEKLNLSSNKHKLQIIGDSDKSEKTIDMLSFIPLASPLKIK